MAEVRLQHISKAYGEGVQALEDVELLVEDRSLLCVVGPSGSGKSTLLNVIAGLDPPTQGEVFLDDACATSWPPHGRDVAMVFQEGALYPHLSVAENLAFGLRLHGIAREEIRTRVGKIAAEFGIADLLDRAPATLSGGQRQRVAIGRALVREPRVLLLDEPLASLDRDLRLVFRDMIRDLRRRYPVTTVYVTHDPEEALALGDRVALLREGRIEQCGTPDEVFRSPRSVFVASFLGPRPINRLEGRLMSSSERILFEGEGVQLTLGLEQSLGLGNYLDRRVTLAFRPEDLDPTDHPDRASDVGESIPAIEQPAVLVENLGHECGVHLEMPSGARILAVLPDRARPEPGEKVRVLVKPDRLLFFDRHGENILYGADATASSGS